MRWVRSGRGVAEGAAAAIAELQGDHLLDEVIVLVPPGSTAATLRRLLPRVAGGAQHRANRGVAGIRFLTPIDLAVELVDSSVSTRRAVTTQLQLAAITSVLSSDDCPPVLRGVRDHAATIDALVDMATALRASHVAPAALRALAGDPASVRSALVEVVVRARQRLAALGVRDESATLAALDAVDDSVLAALRIVLVVTDTFHPAHVQFVGRLSRQPSCRVVAVVPSAGDSALIDQLALFGCSDPLQVEPAAAPRVISCPDPDEEVRHTVRQVAQLIDSGVPADDIAVICAARQYRRPVRDELQRAGIAWSGGAVERLRGSVAGQVVRHVLDGVIGGWDRPSVFRLLSVAPLYPVGEYGAPRRIGQWTSLCRRLGLVSVEDWDRAPQALDEANVSRRRRWKHDDAGDAPTPREAADALALDRLLSLVTRLQTQSRQLRRATTWTAASTALSAILFDHIGASTWRERAWADGPAWQRNAADHVERFVAGLAELDHDGVTVPFSPGTMGQILGTLLDSPVRRRGDAAGAVSIVDVAGAVCIDATHVFVVGVNEGVLPVSIADDLLLGRDLPEIAAAVIEGPRAVASRAERGWHTLLHSDTSVTATWSRADLRRGGEMHPSPLLAGFPCEHHESHEAGLRSGHPLTAAERVGRATDPSVASTRVARRANALRARLAPEPTEFDGIVGVHPALAPADKMWSITAVEHQAACGLGYFGQHVLHIREEVDAASIITIEPMERGVLVHQVFEQLAREWLAIDQGLRPVWLQGDHLQAMHRRAAEVLDELAAGIGIQHRLGHASAWGAERAHLLRSIVAVLDAEAAERAEPVACEHVFAGVGVAGAAFSGVIDRIDVMPGGGLRVTDYKTSAAASVRSGLDEGRRLQLPLYARAADHDAAALTGQDRSGAPPATARYLHVRDAKATSRPVPLDPELIAEFEVYVARWLAEIGQGRFVPRPHPANGRCLMCCVDSLGIEELAERARLFESPADPAPPVPGPPQRLTTSRPMRSAGSQTLRVGEVSQPIVLPAWVGNDPQRSLAVSAGAGSGKTTSLVGRVAALLATPDVELSQLVVITFTEKAAREVSHRLRASLGNSVPLDESFIGTIHGFCHSLLRRYPIEAGLPPKFTTADELTSGAMAEERAEQAVQTLYNLALKDPATEEALMVVASCGAMSFLPELVKAIDNDWLRFDAAPATPVLSFAVAHSTVLRLLDGICGDERYLSATSSMRAKLDAAVAEARSTIEFVESIPALAAAAAAVEERLSKGEQWTALRNAMRFARFEPALTQLMSALTPIVVANARRRVAEGELSFDDLLVLTRRLLQTRPDVRDAVRARHRYLFVDEFQDTDQIQFDILTELTATGTPSPAASMFAVGDPKQSIYGFRNADVSLFSSLLSGDGATEHLTVNRRTRADVCEWINAVLSRRFERVDDDEQPDHQVPFVPLEPQRAANGETDGPGVVVLGMPGWMQIEHESADDTARAEATDVAAMIQQAVGGEHPWTVTDDDDHADRWARYSDITVLVRTRTRLGVLEHTLRQAGVPYRVEGGTLIYGSREVYELLRVLRAVDDPTNQLKVVTALRTSIFGIDDRQLLEFRLGPADADPPPFQKDFAVFTKAEGGVGDALRVLGELNRRKHERTPAELIAELYDRWRGVPAALYEGQQVARETWRRVRYVLDEARAWSDATGGTLAEYLAWVDRRIDDIDRVELSTDEGEDSVRIMTIHAAKGLEFPITIVAGLGGADAPNAATGVRWRQGRPLVRLGKLTSNGLADMTAVERQRERAEEARLMYVAFTRAKDHLVVSMHHKKASHCAAARLVDAVSAETAVPLAVCVAPMSPVAHPPSHHRAELQALLEGGAGGDEPDELDRTIGQVRRIWTPSAIAKVLGDLDGPTTDVRLVQGSLFDDDEADDDTIAPGERFGEAVGRRQADTDDREATDPGNRKEPGPNDRPSRRGGRFGTAKGSAVHAVMQQVALDDPARGLGTLVDVAAEAEGVLDRRHDIEVMVHSLLRGRLFARMQASAKCRREMYVGAQFGEVTVWGYVDAVFVNPDGTLTLVDFKTDTLVTSPAELAHRYQPQMSAYVAALQQATGMVVSEAWLAVAQPDGAAAVEILIDVLDAPALLGALGPTDAAPQMSRQLT